MYKCIKKIFYQEKLKPMKSFRQNVKWQKNHDISVITVENAYAQLIVEGYIYTKEKKDILPVILEVNTLSRSQKSTMRRKRKEEMACGL